MDRILFFVFGITFAIVGLFSPLNAAKMIERIGLRFLQRILQK